MHYVGGSTDAVGVALGGHYFQYRGRSVVLVCCDHCYGAVIDSELDYVAYLKYLGSQAVNVARIRPGATFALDGELSRDDPPKPAAGRQALPWVRTNGTGAHSQVGGRKCHLDRWNEAYFAQLRHFVATAAHNGIVVDVVFFSDI